MKCKLFHRKKEFININYFFTMKKIFFIILASFFVSNSYAINLNDALKEIGNGSSKDVKGFEKKIDKIVDKYDGQLQGEIKKYQEKIEKEEKKVMAMIKEAEDAVNKLKEIKSKASYYINLAKIILAALSSGILVLIFVMWRISRNIVNMKKLIKNVSNYEDFDKRLKKIEKQLVQ